MFNTDQVLKYDAASANYATHLPEAKEVIRQTLYDTATYLGATGQSQLSFFQTPKGQAGKTLSDTNMALAGQLPAGQSFLIEAISFYALPINMPVDDVATINQFANDVYTFGRDGNCVLLISSKNYLEEAPLMVFPPYTGMQIDTSVALDAQAAPAALNTQYGTMSGQPYTLSPTPLMLVPTTNFGVTLNWPTLIPLPSATNMKIVCKLHGVLYRWVQ